jgi:hypothetical protein
MKYPRFPTPLYLGTHGHVEPVHERQMVMEVLILLTLCSGTTAVMSWNIPERPDSVLR